MLWKRKDNRERTGIGAEGVKVVIGMELWACGPSYASIREFGVGKVWRREGIVQDYGDAWE